MAQYRSYPFQVPEAKRLASLAGADTDMAAVVEYCERLEENWQDLGFDSLVMDAFSTAAVVRYGRCFKSGVRDRLPEAALDTARPALREAHRYVIKLRDMHIAHSVNPFEENEVSVQIADHFVSSDEIFAINTAHGRAIGLPSDTPPRLGTLAMWWRSWIEQEMKSERAMLLELAKRQSLEVLKSTDQSLLVADTTARSVGKARSRP